LTSGILSRFPVFHVRFFVYAHNLRLFQFVRFFSDVAYRIRLKMPATHCPAMSSVLEFAFRMINVVLNRLLQRLPIQFRDFVVELASLHIHELLVWSAFVFSRKWRRWNNGFPRAIKHRWRTDQKETVRSRLGNAVLFINRSYLAQQTWIRQRESRYGMITCILFKQLFLCDSAECIAKDADP